MIKNTCDLEIFTFNVRDIAVFSKRKYVFDFLRFQSAHIICLQELHVAPGKEKMFRNQWGGRAYLAPVSSGTGEIGILITTRPAGGRGEGGFRPHPCRNFSIVQNSGGYRRETCSTFLSIDLTSGTKISEKSVDKYLRKWRFSDVMFRNFGWKNSKCLKADRLFSFEVKRNRKIQKT